MDKLTINDPSLVVWFGQWAMHAIKKAFEVNILVLGFYLLEPYNWKKQNQHAKPHPITKKNNDEGIRWRFWTESPREMPSHCDEISQFPHWSS